MSAVAPAPIASFNVNSTFGAAFIGGIFAAVLYGCTCVQTVSVYQQRHDRRWFKVLILGLWVLATFHMAAIASAMYFYLVSNFANPLAIIQKTFWASTGYYVATGVIEFVIRGVLTWRVWKLSGGKWLLALPVLVVSLVNLGSTLAFKFRHPGHKDAHPLSWLLYVMFGASVLADVLIAAALWVLLKRHQTGFARTDSFLKTMMWYSVKTGVLSSLCATLVLTTYLAAQHTYLYATFYWMSPGVMLNSLLATLQATRKQWEESRTDGAMTIPTGVLIRKSTVRSDGQIKYDADTLVEVQTVDLRQQNTLQSVDVEKGLSPVPRYEELEANVSVRA